MAGEKYVAYVSSYTQGDSHGIKIYDVDMEAGRFYEKDKVEITNSSYITESHDGQYLYSITDFGVESYKKTYDELYSVLDLNVGGRFIFDLQKFGLIVAGESTVYKVGEELPHTPFAISVTTRFSL